MASQQASQHGAWSARRRVLGMGALSGAGVGLGAAFAARLILRL
jgi:hypothetical protein